MSVQQYHKTPSTPSESLCERCCMLKLEFYTTINAHRKLGTLGHIKFSTIRNDCNLCFQFAAFFKAYSRHFTSESGEEDEFFLRSVFFHLYISHGIQQNREVYFSIDFKHASSDFRLLPLHGSLKRKSVSIGQVVVPDQPNFEVASNWLRRCRETHLEACNRVHGRTHTLRLIDCKTRRLIVAKQGQPYICLSYVWGEAVHKAEFSTELPDVVPKTVEDAMFVAVNLEIPYLWVDRYCIDQANPLEKHNLIQNMDRVYQNADITIIAAVGDNPHYGLPGVRGTSRQRQLSLTVGEHTFVTAEEVAGQVKKSTWMSRGWTFQEMLLSRRRLIFTESQMYFQCSFWHCVESLSCSVAEPTARLLNVYPVFPDAGIGRGVEDLIIRLKEYYKRQLSFPADTIDAFAGIINAYHGSEYILSSVTHFYGILMFYQSSSIELARTSFLTNLAWGVDIPPYAKKSQPRPTNIFPSWTWAAAKVDWPERDASELRYWNHAAKTIAWHQDDIQVHVMHRGLGAMSIETFVSHDDGYEHFYPFIDLTTWALAFNNIHGTSIFGEEMFLEDLSASHVASLSMVYLGATQQWLDVPATGYVGATFLVVRKLQPGPAGVLRRVGIWNFDVDDVLDRGVQGVEQMLQEILPSFVELFTAHGYADTDVFSKEHGDRWQKRTLRIV